MTSSSSMSSMMTGTSMAMPASTSSASAMGGMDMGGGMGAHACKISVRENAP